LDGTTLLLRLARKRKRVRLLVLEAVIALDENCEVVGFALSGGGAWEREKQLCSLSRHQLELARGDVLQESIRIGYFDAPVARSLREGTGDLDRQLLVGG